MAAKTGWHRYGTKSRQCHPTYIGNVFSVCECCQAGSGERVRVSFVGEFGVFCKNDACYDWVEVRYTGLLNNTGPRLFDHLV